MAAEESSGGTTVRHNSTSGWRGRKPHPHPTVDQLLEANSNDFKLFTEKSTKDWLLCLLRETVSQLRDAKFLQPDVSSIKGQLPHPMCLSVLFPAIRKSLKRLIPVIMFLVELKYRL